MTDRKQALIALRDKVKAGEWPGGIDGAARKVFPYRSSSYDDRGILAAEAFDGSVDAAHALQKTVLPGWVVDICIRGEAVCTVSKSENRQHHTAESNIPARAWLLAILEALIAEADQ